MNTKIILTIISLVALVLLFVTGYIWYGMHQTPVNMMIETQPIEVASPTEPSLPPVPEPMTTQERDQMLERMQNLEPMSTTERDAMVELLNQ